MGQSKTNKKLETQMDATNAQVAALSTQQAQPSEAEAQFTTDKNDYRSWLAGNDYRVAPKSSILNFDLYNPAKQNALEAQYRNVNGIGGLALAQGGNATALQMNRDNMAAHRAETQSAGYEQAVKAQNDYYQGNQLPLAQLEQNRTNTALSNATQRNQFYTSGYVQTAPQPILPTILGAAIGGASSILTGGLSAGGFLRGGK